MRILRFFHSDGTSHTGVREGDKVRDLGTHDPLAPIDAKQLSAAPLIKIDDSKLDVPLIRVPKVLALAGNYHKHIVESGFSDKATGGVWTPQIFWKPSTSLLGHGGSVSLRKKNIFFDWEAELAVVIGKTARDLTASEAMNAVFGYCVINDLSERKYNSEIEGREKRDFDPFFDWLMGKWFDGSAPIGPEIVTKDEIPNPDDLAIRLTLNGETMQDANTSQMIFKIADAIVALSAVLTLEPGDVIAMGTPQGVGFARGRALQAGDHMRAEIEGLGHLDTFVTEKA
jgi:2-keto-4-pentenoate hydratase/2-oxohepta-3-ene-1,7-dioic acid hydratase in catechol pathway